MKAASSTSCARMPFRKTASTRWRQTCTSASLPTRAITARPPPAWRALGIQSLRLLADNPHAVGMAFETPTCAIDDVVHPYPPRPHIAQRGGCLHTKQQHHHTARRGGVSDEQLPQVTDLSALLGTVSAEADERPYVVLKYAQRPRWPHRHPHGRLEMDPRPSGALRTRCARRATPSSWAWEPFSPMIPSSRSASY